MSASACAKYLTTDTVSSAVNHYPIPEAQRSNMRHRPIGVGVQGLADAFMALRMPFDGVEVRKLNRQIFETIYHAAVEASCELAQQFGTYETYQGSPTSEGKLQYDLWGITPTDLWDWTSLKAKVAQHGLRNSLLVAPMPTASTSQILGNNECFEPYKRGKLCLTFRFGASLKNHLATSTRVVYSRESSRSYARGFSASWSSSASGTTT